VTAKHYIKFLENHLHLAVKQKNLHLITCVPSLVLHDNAHCPVASPVKDLKLGGNGKLWHILPTVMPLVLVTLICFHKWTVPSMASSFSLVEVMQAAGWSIKNIQNNRSADESCKFPKIWNKFHPMARDYNETCSSSI
jgi:hypothetical protein